MRKSSEDEALLPALVCVDCKLDLIVSLSLFIGVSLENRVTSVKVSRLYFPFMFLDTVP